MDWAAEQLRGFQTIQKIICNSNDKRYIDRCKVIDTILYRVHRSDRNPQQNHLHLVVPSHKAPPLFDDLRTVVFLLYYRMYSTFVYILQPRAAVKYHCLLTNQPTTGIDC
jgi:hypothetical protein